MYTSGHPITELVDAALDLNSLADGTAWTPKFNKVQVVAVIAEVTNAIGGAGEIRFDKRITFGSDTGRGDGDLGIMTVPDTTAVGKQIYVRPATAMTLSPGEQLVPQVTNVTAASDTADIYVVYHVVPESVENKANLVDGTTA
jgi:hypothetical protein